MGIEHHGEFVENEGKWEPTGFSEFDPTSLDTFEDQVRQALHDGEDIGVLLEKEVEARHWKKLGDFAAKMLAILSQEENPKRALDVICYLVGETSGGKYETQIAARYSVSKQAMNNQVKRLAKQLGIKPGGARRSMEARRKMAQAFARRSAQRKAATTTAAMVAAKQTSDSCKVGTQTQC